MNNTVTFLGTGTSQGVPLIACDCDVCKSDDSKDKRLRTSILINYKNKSIVIDTGPDFRQQMLREEVKNLDAVVFTHEHKDHIAGLDDIRAFNFIHKKAIDVFASSNVLEALKREYKYIFAEHSYPGIPKINVHLITNHVFDVKGVQFRPIEVLHYKLPVFGFRIGGFTYITDANYITENEKNKMIGSKVLVLNALRKEKHVSHFSLDEALELVEELKPEKTYLIHISHQLGKHQDIQNQLPENVFLAFDGLKIGIS